MLRPSIILLSLVFAVDFGNSMRAPYPDPVNKEKFKGDEEVGSAAPAPVADTGNIPDRLKTARTMRHSSSDDGAETASSVSGSVNPADDTKNPSAVADGSDKRKPPSRKPSEGSVPAASSSQTSTNPLESGDSPADGFRKPPSRKPSEGSTPAAPSSQTSTNPPETGDSPDDGFRKPPSRKSLEDSAPAASSSQTSTNPLESGNSPADGFRKPPSRKPSEGSAPAAPSSQISTNPPETGDSPADGFRKPPSRKPSEGSAQAPSSSQTSTNPPAAGDSPAGGSVTHTCDSIPAGTDKVPFSCLDQKKLKDYCTQTFGGGVQSGGKTTGVKHYVVDTTIKANWFQALGLCYVRNMSLATVESYDEQKILSLVLNDARGVQNAWISANDLGENNKYVWMTTGQPVSFTNWYDGEPNHDRNGTEHCVEVINYRWRWNDNICNNQEYFVCQYYSDK